MSTCIFLLASCTKDSLDPKLYSYAGTNTEIKWTAYKYTEKFGISGIFEDFTISGLQYQAPIKDMLADVEIEINTESLNTQSEYRDENILRYFFRTLENHKFIIARVIKVSGTDSKGKIFVMMDFNNQTNEIVFDFKIQNGNLLMEADIDLKDWNAAHTLDNFQDCCATLHTGQDGRQIVWPAVHLDIRTGMEISN